MAQILARNRIETKFEIRIRQLAEKRIPNPSKILIVKLKVQETPLIIMRKARVPLANPAFASAFLFSFGRIAPV